MIKNLIAVIILVAFSSTSFALTQVEQDEFKDYVSELGAIKYTATLANNTVATVGACGFSTVYFVVSGLVDTVPGLAKIQSSFVLNSENEEYEYSGGVWALIQDVVSAYLDSTDNNLDESAWEQSYKAYDETRAIYDAAYNLEDGYCANQAQQLEILIGWR